MKKISLLLLAMLAFSASVMAKSVVFTLANGTQAYYLLGGEKNPVMTFKEGKVAINTDEYELTDIKSFRVSETDDPVGIEQVLDKASVEYKNNQFVVKAADAKTVKVYSMNGTQAQASIATSEGYTTIDLAELPAGIYIIHVGSSSFKVMKK